MGDDRARGAARVVANGQCVILGGDLGEDGPRLTGELGIRRPLVVSSPSVVGGAAVSQLVAGGPWGSQPAVFAGVRPHTPLAGVREAIKLAHAHRADGVIGVGGGSVIDAAKLVSLDAGDDRGFTAHLRPQEGGRLVFAEEAGESALPCVVVPTTLSQSEFTDIAGFTSEDKIKVVLEHPRLQPAAVILDPALSATTPSGVWDSSAAKALDSGVFALVGLHDGCGLAASMVGAAAELLWRGLGVDADQGASVAQRSTLQGASWLAAIPGMLAGFDLFVAVDRWPAGPFRHQLGGVLGLPHALASAALFPALAGRLDSQYPDIAQSVMDALRIRSQSFQSAVIDRFSARDLPVGLGQLGVTRDDLERVSTAVEVETGGWWPRREAAHLLGDAL